MEVKVSDLFRVTVTEYDSGAQHHCPQLTKYFDNRVEANAYAKTQDQNFNRELFYRANVERVA